MPSIIWDVTLEVVGPVKVNLPIDMRQAKGFNPDDQFYSDVLVKSSRYGLTANITAYAPTSEIAYKAALHFFGNMIDVLSFKIDAPLNLYHKYFTSIGLSEYSVKRILDRNIIVESFRTSRDYSINERKSAVLRAMGWYRKALTSNDPIDKFLSLWNVIESLGAKFHTPNERTKSGAINQIFQCFLEYIGEEASWGLEERWINNMHQLRSQLAHGSITIDIHTIEDVAVKNEAIQKQANLLLHKICIEL
jgi:hypothetical protein